MGNSPVMPKVDFKNEELKTAYMYSKYVEAKNFERYSFARDSIRRKRIVLGFGLLMAFGIYSYTLVKIKQETFLDDFEEPETISRK